MTRSRDVSAVQNNLGGAVPPFTAGKNAIINGGFDIWQRGTSFAGQNSSGSSYWTDRWSMYFGTSPSNWTLSRQSTNDSTNLPNIQYCARIQRTAGATTPGGTIGTSIEIVNSIPFAGKAVTISFYARKGANYSESNSQITYTLKSGTGSTDANGIYNSYTGQANVVTGQTTLTTTWQRFTYTGTVSSTATQLAFSIDVGYSGTAGANDYFEITGVQLELGSTATPFSRAGGTIQGELAACQRYCINFNSANANGAYMRYAVGQTYSTTEFSGTITLPVEMRTIPSLTTTGTAANYSVYNGGNITQCNAAPTLGANGSGKSTVNFYTTGTGFTVGRAGELMSNNNQTSYLLLTAEL